jgi:hypothetical protein
VLHVEGFAVVYYFHASDAIEFANAHFHQACLRMAGDIGERFLGDPIEHRSLDAVQLFKLSKDRETNVDARPFRKVFHIRMKSGNKPQFFQEQRTQFTSEAMHDFHRFFHKLLRAGDFLLETTGVDRGLLCQGRQTDVDSRQGLGDFIMKLATDLLSFFLR